MVSLWGSKKDGSNRDVEGQENPQNGESDQHPSFDQREPNERSRLLPSRPRPPNQDGYLDPDDPAVSPYNLWSVRFLRYITVLFLIISFIWWVLLLVSIFISPPGMHSRGSGFFDFAYTCLTIGNLLVALLFFSNPSKAMRILAAIITLFLVVDMIIILAVGRIRLEEGWVGIASVIWAAFISAWCIFVDRVVAWGKREEEERLTGRPETRRTLREWLAVLAATVILVVYIVIVIFMTGTVSIRAKDAGLKMEGERYLVDGNRYEVHLACVGNATSTKGKPDPTIIMEGGEDPTEYDFEFWMNNAMNNGTISRYCYWDRPGYAWSDNAPSPHSAGMSSDALSEALAIAGEEGPWILVSAGTGSVVSRIFASRHPHDVTGIFMIDPLHEDLLHRIASPTRGFILWGWGIISPLGIQRLGGAIFNGRTSQDRVYGRNAYQGGKFIKAQLQENLVADSMSKHELITARTIQHQDTPVVLISSGVHSRTDDEWDRKQEDLSKITNNLVSWDKVKKAPHQVWKTREGRDVMEERLGELVKASRKYQVSV